ncbi:hypothetical protein EIN_020250 [Entamoeba invadens IP1]|uniref:hypothetical protein n=1 Tax=Entamoeba invadens IP1 TaxID=370355 RepID=UPI0002C3D506|nr:hypothetical protein EIN_020250 [Entamoeba invadens IP1]ELP90576.1 hypothetical protein EIN_020250 [Entamoeba invadens IP1]|eukprot:XP_004257347.1 hypothetical protein EIN_020250 [Entamoeba invadens IP1]
MKKTKIDTPPTLVEAKNHLINKLYVANVINRLREIDERKPNDCKRWFWELVQNAKDSISQTGQKSVDISVKITDNVFYFSHNGAPFTGKSALALLYKYSEGKTNDSESTGRFGTGFLTTHTLSKIVSICGDMYYDDEKNRIIGFKTTMYRNGSTEDELLEGVEKMYNSLQFYEPRPYKTTYKYKVETEENKMALEMGTTNIYDNAVQTMLFCKEVNQIKINNKGEKTIFKRVSNSTEGDLEVIKFIVHKGKNFIMRNFLMCQIEEPSEELTKRFKNPRNVRHSAAVEFNERNELVDVKGPSLYCVLPLVGSEKMQFPFLLNSPDFEPESERQGLFLSGKETIEETGCISNTGINRMILKRAIPLYEKFVYHLAEYNYKNIQMVGRGIKEIPEMDANFSKEWYTQNYILPLREVMKNAPIVEGEYGKMSIFKHNTQFVKFPVLKDNKYLGDFYDIFRVFHDGELPLKYCLEEWTEQLWDECEKTTLKMFLQEVEKCECIAIMKTKMKIKDDPFEFLNKLLLFVDKVEPKYLCNYKLIPNEKMIFMRYSDDVIDISKVHPTLVDVVESLGVTNWRDIAINSKIICFKLKENNIYTNSKTSSYIDNLVLNIKTQSDNLKKKQLQNEADEKKYRSNNIAYNTPSYMLFGLPSVYARTETKEEKSQRNKS